jgi:hypothetical protein
LKKLFLISYLTFSIFFFGSLSYRIIFSPTLAGGEFPFHINAAEMMSNNFEIQVPHFLFHIVTIAHNKLITWAMRSNIFSNSYDDKWLWQFSALLVMIEIYVGILVVLVYYLNNEFTKNGIKYPQLNSFLVSFSLCIVQPVFLFAPIDGKYYLGYLTPANIYFIPTQVLLKLPSLGLFLSTSLFFRNKARPWIYFAIGFLAILSGLAKPNYLIDMLPAFSVLLILMWNRSNYVNWKLVLFTYSVILLLLSWQYSFKFADPSTPIYKSSIAICYPFEVWSYHSQFVFFKVFLSTLFPIYVALVYWVEIRKDTLVIYAWLLFIFGLIITAFLCETQQKYAGNFVWSGQIANFMLFVSSAAFFFSKAKIQLWIKDFKIATGVCIFISHVMAGFVYYFRSFWFSFS